MTNDAEDEGARAGPTLLLCSCEKTMTLDADALGATTRICDQLCGGDVDLAIEALKTGSEVTIACGQEAARFEELADELGAEGPVAALRTVDIRDRAGWSEEAANATAKQAALLAEGALEIRGAPLRPVVSEGVCLVYGPGEVAFRAAERLSATLGVTCLLTEPGEVLPPRRGEFAIATGRIASAAGHLGSFDVKVDGFAEAEPGGRGGLRFGEARDGGRSACDLIVDLSGAAPLFPAPEKRDGYLRADPNDPIAVERALFDAAQMVGEFEKPLYIRFEESLCAHSRARQPGCDRCLNLCPTGAITPNGDHVSIDPMICAGCGACAAVCPTGAASYDDPSFEQLVKRMTTLAETYRGAGGAAPRLLIHDVEHGAEMIALAARFSRGLPAAVIPLEVSETAMFGHAAMLSALALGFEEIRVLLGPKSEREAVEPQVALANAMAAGVHAGAAERIAAIEPSDPDELCDLLYGAAPAPLGIAPILPLGEPRAVTRLAMNALAGDTPPDTPVALGHVEMPSRVPYGAVLVDTDACTLCLSCVSLCPTGALEENEDRPELRFREDACVQCGICSKACPETAITLEPRFNLSDDARQAVTLKEEEPFACIECGALFGVKSTIERITEKLAGVNWMYTNSDNVRLIQMCDDCRVRAQYHSESSPFAMGDRPKVRTTEDYLLEREEEETEKNGGKA